MDVELLEAAKVGDVENFLTCLESFTRKKKIPLASTFSQLTDPDRDTFLHVAASYGHEELSGFIAHHFRYLITCKNHKGDSALHLAAREGHFGVVEIILSFRNDKLYSDSIWDDDLVITDEKRVALVKQRAEERVAVNDEGNTALHEALLNDHKDIAEYLIKGNVEAAYYVNKQGKSPLYMAVEAGNTEYVNNILNGRSEYMHLLDEQLTNGKSLLHAAIIGRNIEILQKITKKKPMLIHIKNEGLGPLEFASSIGFLEGVNLLKDRLIMNTSDHGVANVNNEDHKNPEELRIEDIRQSEHWEGRHKRLNRLLDAKKVENSNEGPQHGSDPHSMKLALYIAAKKGDIDGFIDALDTPVSIIYNQMTPLKNTVLHVADRPKLEKLKSTTSEPYNMDYSKDRVNTLLLVSTLIATVTFAAGFTMPGGYSSSEPDQGMATLLNKLTFQVFVICDTIAMYSAIMVAVSLIWAQLGDLTLVLNALKLAIPLLGISLTMMSLAFMVGVYVVVSKLVWLASVVLIVGIISLACLLSLFIPLNLPYTSTALILRYISYYPFCLLMLASGSYYDPDIEDDLS